MLKECHGTRGINSAVVDDLDSNDDSLWEDVLKIVADKDVTSLGSQREGEEGKDMGAPVTASGEEEAQHARLS